jgi:hypothetical protein
MPRGSNSCEQSLAAIATYTTVVLAPHAVDDGGGASDTRRDFDRLAGAIHLAGATLHAVFAMGDEGLAFDEGGGQTSSQRPQPLQSAGARTSE